MAKGQIVLDPDGHAPARAAVKGEA